VQTAAERAAWHAAREEDRLAGRSIPATPVALSAPAAESHAHVVAGGAR
jgi:hypothetical protein